MCFDINCLLFDYNLKLIDKFRHESVSHSLLMKSWRLLLLSTQQNSTASDAVRRVSSSGIFTSKADICNFVTFSQASVSSGERGGSLDHGPYNLHSFVSDVLLMRGSWLGVWNLIQFHQRSDYTLNAVQTLQYVGLSRYWENIFSGFFFFSSRISITNSDGFFSRRGEKKNNPRCDFVLISETFNVVFRCKEVLF